MATPLMSLPDQTPGKGRYVVPWKSRLEFLKIYHDIFSEDEGLQLNAIKRIKTWKSRTGTKLSVAVQNTGSLLESIINHNVAVRENHVDKQDSFLRSCYSLAVVRFVNHVTEKGQNKATAQPVHAVAREYGIPEWIVRLRHDATHGTMPSLVMLATAAAWALHYLKEGFWDCQSHDSTGEQRFKVFRGAKLSRKIRQILNSFCRLRLKEIRSTETNQNATSGEIQQLKLCLREDRFCFMKCLLEDGAFVSTLDQLDDFGLNKEDLTNQLSLPVEVYEFWQPVVSLVQNTGTVSTLVKVAMLSLSDDECLRNYLLVGWLSFFLSGNAGTLKKSKKKKGSKKSLSWESGLPRKLVLSVCLDKINKFTIHLLQYVIDREELGQEAYDKLSDLLNITPPGVDDITHDDSGDEEDEPEEDSVYTVEDVKEASFSCAIESSSSSQPVLKHIQASVSEEDTGWKICTDLVDWSRVPLGVVPSLSGDGNGTEEVDQDDDEDDLDDNKDESCDDDCYYGGHDDDDDEDEDDRTRDWRRSQRKRSTDDENKDLYGRSPPKRCTYIVNDTELL